MAIRARTHIPLKHFRSRLGGQAGMSLPEVLVSIPIMLAVLAVVAGVFGRMVNTQVRLNNRNRAALDAKIGLERMTRELRTAIVVDPRSSEMVDAEIPGNTWVRYDCSYVPPPPGIGRACARLAAGSQLQLDSVTLPPVVVSDVLNYGVFGYSPDLVNPTYVTVTLRVKTRDLKKQSVGSSIVLSDGFNLRNLTTAS